MWEYLVTDLGEWHEGDVQRWLNKRGEEGWELVHVSQSMRTYFLKRIKEEETPVYCGPTYRG